MKSEDIDTIWLQKIFKGTGQLGGTYLAGNVKNF
jgi:hypothetical protein